MGFLDRADAVARKLEQFIAGSGPADPLYLSNRSGGQKLRLALLVGAPVVALGALVVLALNNYFVPAAGNEKPRVVHTVPGEITAKVLPDLEKTYKSESDADCNLIEAGISNQTLSGKVRNDTERLIHAADLVFDLTDEAGSQLAAVAVRVENIAPHAIAPFRLPLEQSRAKTALVREIHTR